MNTNTSSSTNRFLSSFITQPDFPCVSSQVQMNRGRKSALDISQIATHVRARAHRWTIVVRGIIGPGAIRIDSPPDQFFWLKLKIIKLFIRRGKGLRSGDCQVFPTKRTLPPFETGALPVWKGQGYGVKRKGLRIYKLFEKNPGNVRCPFRPDARPPGKTKKGCCLLSGSGRVRFLPITIFVRDTSWIALRCVGIAESCRRVFRLARPHLA